MAATPSLCAALRSPISSRRFSPIRKTNSPFHFSFVPSSLPSPSSFTLPRLFGSVPIGGRLFPRLSAAKQQVDQDEVGFDQEPSQEIAIASACLVGVLTGISVVLFNNCVHLLRDFSWDGIPDRGASYLREAPIGSNWLRVILVPTIGGLVVSVLNQLLVLIVLRQCCVLSLRLRMCYSWNWKFSKAVLKLERQSQKE